MQPKSETDSNQSQCEAEVYAASACAGELQGLGGLFKELHHSVSVHPEKDAGSARHFLQRRGPRRTQAH